MNFALAFIPLNKGAKISPPALKADFAERWPDRPKLKTAKTDAPKQGQISFDVGESLVILQHIPAPIPWGDLEGPCATSILWPDAEAELKPHTSHLIATVASDENPIEQSTLLTQACASVLATCEQAPGVYWGNATLVVPRAIFLDFATEILPEGPPVQIWVDVRVGRSETLKGRTEGFTTGLAALGHMELETQNASDDPGELRERLWSIANYLLESGPVIKDGNTVGEDAKEKIKVRYTDSAFGHEGQVMRLEYSSTKTKK